MVHHKSSQHSPADMANTLQQLHEKIWLYNCHHPTWGLRVNTKVLNALVAGTVGYTHVNINESDGVKKGLELEELAVEDFDAL